MAIKAHRARVLVLVLVPCLALVLVLVPCLTLIQARFPPGPPAA